MIEKIATIVEHACHQKTNFFGYGIWTHHILKVVHYAKMMAQKLNANEEIVEIAALLHDYASIKDYRLHEDHHIYGAEEADKILKQFHYPAAKIEQVKHCIMSHRGKKVVEKKTVEAICVTDADAMAHFDSVSALFYLAFIRHQKGIDETTTWLKHKLERSWNKLSAEGKEIVRDKYEASQVLLGGFE